MSVFHPRDTIRAWARHTYGQAMRLQDQVYVPIPKVGSTWCKQLWHGAQDINFKIHDVKHLTHVVILRNPIERWIAGFAQCQVGNDPACHDHWERLGWQWVFDQMVFDNHTEPQVSFIDGVDLDRVIWFRLENNVENAMTHYLFENFGIDRRGMNVDRYRGVDQPAPIFKNLPGRSQADLQRMAREALATIPGARQRTEDFYKEDIELYNSVKYLNKEQ